MFTARYELNLYIPPGLTFNNSTFCPHSVFMCFVWIWEQTAIISLYNINWLVCITETESVYCAVRTGSLNVQSRFLIVFKALITLPMPEPDQQNHYFAVLLIFLAVTEVTKLPPGFTFRSVLLTPDTLPFALISFFLWTNSPFGYTSVWDASLSCVQSGTGLSVLRF